jgi:adenylate kinase
LTATENKFRPGPILLMGAPGVGKGTQAKELMARWGVPQISTGDLLRGNVASSSRLGLQAKQLMDSGQLVPDHLVEQMVAQRLSEGDVTAGYLLDGFPRTLGQAEWLDRYLAGENAPASLAALEVEAGQSTRAGASLPLVAVSLRVEYTRLLRRITGRRICPRCGSIYNTYLQPPVRDGFCDLDGTPLQRRDDDSEVVFEDRMHAYETLTAPVVEHYRALGRLLEIDGEGSPETVTGRVEQVIQEARSQA